MLNRVPESTSIVGRVVDGVYARPQALSRVRGVSARGAPEYRRLWRLPRDAGGWVAVSTGERAPSSLSDPPMFELTCLQDDPEDPSEVTIVPAGSAPERYLTEWITADTATAVSVDEMR